MNHYSVELIAKQKIKELRKEAQWNRLAHQAAADRQDKRSFLLRLLAWVFRKPGVQQENRYTGARGLAGRSADFSDIGLGEIIIK